MMSRAFWLCLLSACASTGGAESLVGESCTAADECDVSGICITDGPGGLCSLECLVPGGAGQCPGGSYCDRSNVSTDDSASRQRTVCLPACEHDDDCRSGYSCNGVSGGPGKVCRPSSAD
jgi:hypothetical protein